VDEDAPAGFPRSPEGQEQPGRSTEIDELSALCRLCGTCESNFERKLIELDLQQLKLALSDQNLELLPDYEQRVDVLKSLQFIDDNATVLLKGRVACEVSGIVLC
jgi:antiviral helicase SKI2